MIYTLEDIRSIKDNGFSYKLPENTQELIKNLARLVGSPDYIKTPVFHKKHKNIEKEPDWEIFRKFKPTEKVDRTDNEKIIQSLKGALNKLTNKNYNVMRDVVFNDLQKLQNVDNLTEIYKMVFEILSSNRFYSIVYAKLYYELAENYAYFGELIDSEIKRFINTFSDIKNVNPNDDYDLFCKVNKENERRRALCDFFVNLMHQNVILTNEVVELFDTLYDELLTKVNDENHKHTVIEFSENIYTLMEKGNSRFRETTIWDNMIEKISVINKMKLKENKGLSNKSLFKFMDIMDIKE
jgi:hypothetical protein